MAINAKPRGYLFEEVPDDSPQRSAFDLSFRSVFSADFDYLYPILCEEVLPNSDYELNLNLFMRTAPLVAPVFQDIDVKIYHFWTPDRIIFRKWKKLISNGDGSVSISDALAAKKLVDMPFITNYDLAQRGNFSFTDPFGVHSPEYLRTQTPSSGDYDDTRDVYNYLARTNFILNGESRGSLADYLGIPDTKIYSTYLYGQSITQMYYNDEPFNPFELKSNIFKASNYEGMTIQSFRCGDGINFGSVPISEAWRNDISLDWSLLRALSYSSIGSDDVYYGSVEAQKISSRIRLGKNLRTYNSLPFRAYNKIYYDWFRDENLQSLPDYKYNSRYYEYLGIWQTGTGVIGDASTYLWNEPLLVTSVQSVDNYLWSPDLDYYNDDPSISGSWDNQLNVGLLRKSFQKDYLTSALPSPQRGADVVLPVSGEAKLVANNGVVSTLYVPNSANPDVRYELGTESNNALRAVGLSSPNQRLGIDITNNTTIDLSNVNSLTIEALRVANKLQQFLEKFARTGSRYVEMMLSHFDTLVPDAASERPTLLATARIPIQISANSSESAVQIGDEVTPQGTQTGQAMSNGSTGFRFHADEHGYLMTLLCIEPRTFYGSSLSRMWLRRGWLDYAWPKFANLGEQSVYLSEVYPTLYPRTSDEIPDKTQYDSTLTGADVLNMKTFGYQSRYSEYKYHQDEIHGDFRHSLDYWTLARFPEQASITEPRLNEGFIRMNVIDRQNIFHTTATYGLVNTNVDNYLLDGVYSHKWTDHFYFDARFNFKAIKPLPLFGVPTL